MTPSGRARLLAEFERQREALLRFLRQRLGNFALAEELTQEVWLRAAAVDERKAVNHPRAFLFRIASNLAADQRRHVGLGIEVPTIAPEILEVADPAPSPEQVAISRSELARLVAAAESLSPRRREVFYLAKIEGLSNQEIADRLGISKATVVSHVFSALQAIERELRRRDG